VIRLKTNVVKNENKKKINATTVPRIGIQLTNAKNGAKKKYIPNIINKNPTNLRILVYLSASLCFKSII
jgi:hypothetical protein